MYYYRGIKKYLLYLPVLSYMLAVVLVPCLHMGGIICPHAGHASTSHSCCESEDGYGTPTYNSYDCDDDTECQICSFLANCSAISGIICSSLSTHYANFTFASHGVEIDIAKSIDLSNPPTAPPFSI